MLNQSEIRQLKAIKKDVQKNIDAAEQEQNLEKWQYYKGMGDIIDIVLMNRNWSTCYVFNAPFISHEKYTKL